MKSMVIDSLTMEGTQRTRRVVVSVFFLMVTCGGVVLCKPSHWSVSSSVSSSSGGKQFVFHDSRQEAFVKSLSDYVITIPTSVTSEGDYVTHHLHPQHSLVKRHAFFSSQTQTPNNTDVHAKSTPDFLNRGTNKADTALSPSGGNDVFHYQIPVHDGKHVVVRMRENTKLLAPGAVVERRSRVYLNASDSEFRSLQDRRSCHMTGTVLGDTASRVALAACQGLTGFFHTDGEQYLIEPVKGHDPASDPLHRHPHVVYKRSALPAHLTSGDDPLTSPDAASCGVQDDVSRVVTDRERWERRRHRRENRNRQTTAEGGDGGSRMEEGGRGRRRRRKRSISSEKHTETLVVVDADMMRYYQNEDIENYVLTVMNMVSTLFHDASIGNAINIAIVRLLLLKDDDGELQITHHADKTLRSFCRWQKAINFRDDDHPNHHDVAILLTRRNICNRMNKPCSTLGLSQVSGLCQSHRSCNINEDTGLSLAWTVTHELGHNFGMKHDTKRNDCLSPPGEMYVMAPHLSWDLTPTRWSACSRQAITKFLDRDWGYCLEDEPGHHDFQYPVLPPGTMYDADHQCRLLYGQHAAVCASVQNPEDICSTLWCRVNNKCSTKLQPAAEGTICGTNKWCYAGKCVVMGERPQAINGEWGQWGEWTTCTRTCGAGISHSQRFCNHPPPSNGGKYCIGERKRFRLCNTEACPDSSVTFRHMQCAEFNNIPYKGNKYHWVPVATPDSPCQLHCKPANMFFSVLLRDITADGTPCVPGGRHMCISGRCRHVGCDWEIDSHATEDRCGVCYGDGSTCTTVKQQFNETKKHGYVEATVIPTGARNIRVEEVAEAKNFLALRGEEGQYYLNGHWFIQWSGDYQVAGTVVRYQRHGNKESFWAPGPIKEPLHIMLLMQTHNPGVVFEYTVPKENATERRQPEFYWDFTSWSHCTLSCGGGTQRSEVQCIEKEAGRVDDRFCHMHPKPDDKLRRCNEHLCPARWWAGPWQHCSVTCGEGGTHRRSVMCVRSLGQDEQMALEDTACRHLARPVALEPCRVTQPCPVVLPTWLAGNWTQCSGNPCALQTREVVCSDVTRGCNPLARPVTSRPCSNVTCGKWKADDWSTCTRTCGGGAQYRKVTCVGGMTCDAQHRPLTKQVCGENPCPQVKEANDDRTQTTRAPLPTVVKYQVPSKPSGQSIVLGKSDGGISLGTGSEPSTTQEDLNLSSLVDDNVDDKEAKPGNANNVDLSVSTTKIFEDKGLQERHQHHRHRHGHSTGHGHGLPRQQKPEIGGDNSSAEAVPASEDGTDGAANAGIQKDTETAVSEDKVQGGDDRSGDDNDGEGGGVTENTETDEKEGKATGDNDYDWYAGQWRKCSSECGSGVQTRAVSCFRKSTATRVDGHHCSIRSKPSAIQECNTQPCVQWEAAPWGQCSATCGYAMRRRSVQCPAGGRCNPETKPREVEVCSSLSPCIAWVTGDWSKCSKSCDGGFQQRLVQCVNVTSQQVSDRCNKAVRPPETQSCSTDHCPATDAAFTVNCESNEMSYRVCRMLRKVGLCHKDYVQTKCCRTCADHRRKSPANRIADGR